KTVLSESKAGTGGGLDIFTVRATDRFHLQAQGVITPTYHWADMAINGRGFFMVAPPSATGAVPTTASTDDPSAVLYTRAGTFQEKAGDQNRSYLIDSGGNHLLGWKYDDTGTAYSSTLEPIYTTPETTMAGQATGTAQILANLPATVEVGPSGYSEAATVTDGNGVNRDVTFTWTRVDGQTWNVTASLDPTFGTITSGATYSVTRDPFTGTITSTPATVDLGITWNPGYFNALVPATQTETESLGTLSGVAPALGHLEKIHLPVFDAQFDEHSVALGFERVGANTWYMHLEGGSSVRLDFDSNGQMTTAQPLTVNASFTSGTPPVTTTQAISLDLEKVTQYDGPLYIGEVEQDGFGNGQMRYTRINQEGDLEAFFTNGEMRKLWRIPVATFRSENNLSPLAGTLYARTAAAGDIYINSVDDAPGGGGTINAESLENSTVDIADEFTRMIMTQKAYSTNATVFRTADEMTTTVRDLKS
ncbi:MAG: flagellar hook-basal body complex protein, partial [Pseudomonadota bacterium]